MATEAERARKKAYYLAHRDEILARVTARAREKAAEIQSYKREWNRKNRTRIAEKKRQNYVAKRATILAWHRANYKAKTDAIKARVKRYRDANSLKVRTVVNRCVRAWRLAHPEKAAEVVARRRARLLSTQADAVDYAKILRDAEGLCGICRQPLDLFGTEFDHIIPLARGGAHTNDNIQVAHAHCNRVKGARVA